MRPTRVAIGRKRLFQKSKWQTREGELALGIRFARDTADPAAHLRDIATYGEDALIRSSPDRRVCDFLWLSGKEPFLSPKGQWNGVRMRIVAEVAPVSPFRRRQSPSCEE